MKRIEVTNGGKKAIYQLRKLSQKTKIHRIEGVEGDQLKDIKCFKEAGFELKKLQKLYGMEITRGIPENKEFELKKKPFERKIKRKDLYHTVVMKEIEILGVKYPNREVSTAFNVYKGTTTVNATAVKDGSGKIEINGVPLHIFFQGNQRHMLKALSPFTLIQSFDSFDAIVSVTGLGGGEMAFRDQYGFEERKPMYGRYNNYQFPNLGAWPDHGPDVGHHRAIANGGAQAAQAVASALCEALIPLVPGYSRKQLFESSLMLPDVRRKERTWITGAGTQRIRGRRPKKWRRR